MAKNDVAVRTMDMQTALAVLSGTSDNAVEMSQVDMFFMEEGSKDEDAFDFVPSKIKVALGGAKGFVSADGKNIDAPLVGYALESVKIRGYWPRKSGNKVPFCSSLGARVGVVNMDFSPEDLEAATEAVQPHRAIVNLDGGESISEYYHCNQCPLSQFGSEHQGGSGLGQACKMRTRLLFLPEGWSKPAILTLPTMSVSGWNEFCSALETQHRRRYYAFKIALDVEPKENRGGDPFGMIVPKLVGPITDMEVASAVVTIQRQMREYVRSQNIVIDENGS